MLEGLESCAADLLIADLSKGPNGSGLHSFELDGWLDDLGIWDVMARNKILVTLKVDNKNSARCTHLQELELVDYHMPKECKAFAMR
jgi:hypothetical protein